MVKEEEKKDPVKELLQDIKKSLGSIDKRFKDFDKKMTELEMEVQAMKTGKDERFKLEPKKEDIIKAKEMRKGVDPRIIKIVNEMLGEDFAIQIEPEKDKPGFNFTLIVPQRLSLLPKSQRPILREDDSGKYRKNRKGVVILEDYYPEDRRTRAIASTDNFDAIKRHCERVRANIVITYQKLNKPLPEFRIKR